MLAEHPGVAEVAVVGRPDPFWGEAITAVVVPSGDPPGAEEIRAFARERLAAFKVPVKVKFWSEPLPRNANGKVLKSELRKAVLED